MTYLTIWATCIAWLIIYIAVMPRKRKTKLMAALKNHSAQHTGSLNKTVIMWVIMMSIAAPLVAVLTVMNDIILIFKPKIDG